MLIHFCWKKKESLWDKIKAPLGSILHLSIPKPDQLIKT
jgi:hypothetical protein